MPELCVGGQALARDFAGFRFQTDPLPAISEPSISSFPLIFSANSKSRFWLSMILGSARTDSDFVRFHSRPYHDLELGWRGRRHSWHDRYDRGALRRYRARLHRSGELPPDYWEDDRPYWERTRGPMSALAIVVPLLALYEWGLVRLVGAGAVRSGADSWILHELSRLTPVPGWIVSALLVSGIVVWQAVDRNEWWCGPVTWIGMLVEGCILGIGLVGLSRLLDLGFIHLEGQQLLADGVAQSPATHQGALAVGFLGAGLFEEAIFRLAMIPAIYGFLRLLQAPAILATTTAVTASAILFALAHHLGDTNGEFIWFVFVFRWAAGVYFAWTFILRGFGVVVVAHVTYDLLVGCLGWTF
jgi:Type II CAAX prenyl endopeptidase Rce1-like